jgi:hypothetical protein
MPFSSSKHKGYVSNYTGNGVHCIGAFEYYQINDPTGTIDPLTGQVRVVDIATRIGFYSSDDAGANYSEIVVNKGNLALSANNATLSNVTVWGSDSILTQGRGDGRYATPSCLTYTNITGTPNLSLYLTTANAASTYYLATNPTGYITASCLTYGNITGTPNLSLYLTTANAALTYLPSANFSFANITGKPTTLSGYGITDGLTTSNASATYATISSLSSYATLTTNTFTGQQNFGSNILDKPRLQALRESYSSPTISSGTLTLDLSVANNFYTSLNAAITTLSITNVPASTMEASFKLELTSDGTARAITWPGSFTWLSGSAPSVPSTNGAKTVLIGYTKDGGTSWAVGSNK